MRACQKVRRRIVFRPWISSPVGTVPAAADEIDFYPHRGGSRRARRLAGDDWERRYPGPSRDPADRLGTKQEPRQDQLTFPAGRLGGVRFAGPREGGKLRGGKPAENEGQAAEVLKVALAYENHPAQDSDTRYCELLGRRSPLKDRAVFLQRTYGPGHPRPSFVFADSNPLLCQWAPPHAPYTAESGIPHWVKVLGIALPGCPPGILVFFPRPFDGPAPFARGGRPSFIP